MSRKAMAHQPSADRACAPSGLSHSSVSQAEPLVPCAAMSDAELLEYAASFRRGLLGSRSSISMCAAVSWPLAGLLRFEGVDCEAVESDLSEELGMLYANHVWIRLADGRVLDPTADQFNRWDYQYPDVYLGPPTELHGNPQAADVRRLLPASGMPLRENAKRSRPKAGSPPLEEGDAQ